MELMWPDLDAEAAAANLWRVAHRARRALGDETAIVLEGGLVKLWPAARVVIDVDRFEDARRAIESGDSAACDALLAAAHGELLPGDPYLEWAQERREKLHSLRLGLLRTAGRWQDLVDLDPLDEAAHRRLIRGYLASGDRRSAIRQFERLQSLLREELGVEPDPETVALLGLQGESREV
jgi:DNA-binding SARP family transcriptional activator